MMPLDISVLQDGIAWVVEEQHKDHPEEDWRPREVFTVFAAAQGCIAELSQKPIGEYMRFRIGLWERKGLDRSELSFRAPAMSADIAST
jgi:hypothetical protein